MKCIQFVGLAALCLFLFSCEKRDKAITLPPKGDGVVIQVNMGEEYGEQFYVSLENQQIVHSVPCNIWDLAFSCKADDYTVYMNGGQGMCAYPTGKSDFATVGMGDTSLAASNWLYDGSTGEVDSAIIKWSLHSNQVYIVKLDKNDTKYKKIKIAQADAFQYSIEVGELDDQTPQLRTLVKNTHTNFTYFSLHHFTEVANVEPAKNSYDLKFTTYNYSFYEQNPPLRYIVVGCLLNATNTSAYKDSTIGFTSLTKDLTAQVQFNTHWDAIGYDWKKIDWASGSTDYTIDKRFSFIVKTQNNRYFRLRFLDFYSPTGEKGSPKFEFQEL
ncbi:MAG: HmuY family protein [Chitinophagaceae bacterium]|nr:HmuY family protein [Chitinophagaceae bacterium]